MTESLGSRFPNQIFYKFPKVNFVISNRSFRIIQCTSLAFFTLGLIDIALSKLGFSALIFVNPVAAGAITAAATVILLGTYFLAKKLNNNEVCIVNNKMSIGCRVTSRKNESPQLLALLDELCTFHNPECSYERAKEIINILKKNNKLSLLNTTIFSDDLTNFFDWRGRLPCTPLHYWADKGDLNIVKLLVENGAKDHFSDGVDLDELMSMKSGIFYAAFHGNFEITEYLLNNGSLVDISFAGNSALWCFVPTLVFVCCCYGIYVNEKKLKCLELILSRLKTINPNNLDFQMREPVSNDKNILMWLSKKKHKSSCKIENIEQLFKLLRSYGANEKNVFSKSELASIPNSSWGNLSDLVSPIILK